MKLPDVRVHVECGTRHGHGPKPADPDLACDASENVKGSVESWHLSLFLSPANTYEHHPRTRTLCRVPRRRDLVAFHGPASHVHPLCRHVRFRHSKRFQRVVGKKLGPRHAEVVSVNLRFSPACRCLGPSNDRWMQNRQERRNPVSRREPGADARPLGPRPCSRLGLAGGSVFRVTLVIAPPPRTSGPRLRDSAVPTLPRAHPTKPPALHISGGISLGWVRYVFLQTAGFKWRRYCFLPRSRLDTPWLRELGTPVFP